MFGLKSDGLLRGAQMFSCYRAHFKDHHFNKVRPHDILFPPVKLERGSLPLLVMCLYSDWTRDF